MKLSEEFSRTESRILGALSRLDDFLLNPLIQGYSRTTLEASRNAYGTNQATNEEHSQSDRHPEASVFQNQTSQNSRSENGHDIVTGGHEEATHCSPRKSLGKQMKTLSASQPQFCSESTPETIEADQILLALQWLANNGNSGNFNDNIHRMRI